METMLQQTYAPVFAPAVPRASLFARFLAWSKNQEPSRFLWLGVSLATHGCFLTPLTVFVITLTGNSLVSWGFAIAAMAMTLVANLAALPTKVTIPVFLFSVLVDLVLVIVSLAVWFS